MRYLQGFLRFVGLFTMLVAGISNGWAAEGVAAEAAAEAKNAALAVAEVAKHGLQNEDPYALLVAVRMMNELDAAVAMTEPEEPEGMAEEAQGEGEAGEAASPPDIDVYDPYELVSRAKELATGDEKLLAELGDVESEIERPRQVCIFGWCAGVYGCWTYCPWWY